MKQTKDIFFLSPNGKYGYLSNFLGAPTVINDKFYHTTEHYFQAMKTINPEEQEMVRNASTPDEAKHIGQYVTLCANWEDIKEVIMLTGLREKFTQHPILGNMLLSTDNAVIHEAASWDKYWGYAKGAGKDRLGILLMQVREELRSE